MNKKTKLRYRAVLSLMLSAVLFCMPVAAFSMNGNNIIDARAEEETESSAEEKPAEQETESSTEESTAGEETEGGTEENQGEQTENGAESGTVSGNDAEPVCTCEDKCGSYEYDRNCKVCVEDYKLCAYKRPNVSISINKPDGWFNDTVAVTFRVADVAHTGNFEVAKIQAKVGQNGSWIDVTEDKKLDISENCTVYVQVTDQKGNTYEKNRAIKCFDTTKPTLNAAVSDGLLSVQVHDTDSGAKAVYVNGYEFTELTNGTLNIRLQQFDAGYEYFTISAMDNAGNMSEVYKTKNPYYKDPADESDENPAGQLPIILQFQFFRLKPDGPVFQHAQAVIVKLINHSCIYNLFCHSVQFGPIRQIVCLQTNLRPLQQFLHNPGISPHRNALVSVIEIIVVIGKPQRQPPDDKSRQIPAVPSPLFLRIPFDQLLIYIPSHQRKRLFFQILGLRNLQIRYLTCNDILCFPGCGNTPHPAESIHIKGQVI